jgi:hypothetical protein
VVKVKSLPEPPVGHVLAVDGLRAGSHADLVGPAVVADHRAGGVGAVPVPVTGHAGVSTGRIPPVVVVVGRRAVPAAVLVDDRRVVPHQAGVVACHHQPLASEAQVPDLGRPDEADVGLDRGDVLRGFWINHRFVKLELPVGRDLSHIGAGRQAHH